MRTPPIVVDSDALVSKEDIIDRRPELRVYEGTDVVESIRSATPPTVLISSNPAWSDTYLAELQSGDWVATTGAGYDSFPLDHFEERGIAFTHMPGNNAPQVAEHAIAMMLSFSRRLWRCRDQQREKRWENVSGGMTHHTGKRCCVVGLGHIGEEIAKRLKSFGMVIHGVKRSVENYTGHADSIYPPSELNEALHNVDLLILSLPLTDDTRHMIGKPELDQTADDVIIVNVGRGPVLETDALLAALAENSIKAAGLDVTDPEPLPLDSPLWDKEDVLITFHSGWNSDRRADQFLDEFLELYDVWTSKRTLPEKNRIV